MDLKWDLPFFPLTILTIGVQTACKCFHAATAVDDSTTEPFSDDGVLPSFPEKLKQEKRRERHFLALCKSAKSEWNFSRHRYLCKLTVLCGANNLYTAASQRNW